MKKNNYLGTIILVFLKRNTFVTLEISASLRKWSYSANWKINHFCTQKHLTWNFIKYLFSYGWFTLSFAQFNQIHLLDIIAIFLNVIGTTLFFISWCMLPGMQKNTLHSIALSCLLYTSACTFLGYIIYKTYKIKSSGNFCILRIH